MRLQPSNFNYYSKINSRYTFINNTLTGALDIIKSSVWDLVLQGKFQSISSNPLSNLIERGYLYYDSKKEKELFKTLYNNYIQKATSRPVRFVFCPTYRCNLRCIYCFEKDLPHNPHKYMDSNLLEEAIKAAEEISKKYEGKIESVELFGGEPLLLRTKPLVKRILDFAKSKNATITIVTNGIRAIDFIDIMYPFKKDIDMLQITVDGPLEVHDSRRKYPSGKGSFYQISKSIDALLKNNINTNVRVNIDNTNIDYLPQLYQYVYEKGWIEHPNFSIKPSLVTDHSTLEYNNIIIPEEKLLEKLIKTYDQHPWLEEIFGFYLFKPLRHILDIINGAPNIAPRFVNCESNLLELNVFCPDGHIYVCPESIGNKDIAIGKFSPRLEFDSDKINIWKERTIAKMEECCLCKFSPICGGGCTYSSILIFKKYNNPVCERFQEVLDTFVKLRGERIFSNYLKES